MSLSLSDQGDLFRFLGRIFGGEMDVTLVSGLRALGTDTPGWLRGFLVRTEGVDSREVTRLLSADYARLFYGMSKTTVPPYESVFVGDMPLLMRDQRDQVVAAYRDAGFEVEESQTCQEDHIAIECEFCGLLCMQECDAISQGDSLHAEAAHMARRAFARDHMATWVSELARQIRAQERSRAGAGGELLGFYSDCADVLCALVREVVDDEPMACERCIA
ncbi:molecular chaperone TorD family protein [bacterium]|nr:molecular chaperone TorD family protein [bacterium]